MRVFVTGATGFIGSAVIPELIAAGHEVVGVTRTADGAAALQRLGAQAHFGSLEEPDSLRRGAAEADGVIHLAFNHDFSKIEANSMADRLAIEAMAEALKGSGRPLVGTAGVLVDLPVPGQMFGEDDPKPVARFPRVSEEATLATLDEGVKGIVMRLSQIHDRHRQGLVSRLIQMALQRKTVAYVGEGANRWAAAHRSDTARLYRLVLEKATAGSKWHAVAEQGVTSRSIAEAIGRRLKLPVISIDPQDAASYFGLMSHFMLLDSPSANAKTCERMGWQPVGPTLIDDLDHLVLPPGA
ncbi:MAG: SDR family oxidoreductase [Hyphomicrobiales bacterium]|nr:SDR family oxidoreductase [Hyphomicrobiales bacterium]